MSLISLLVILAILGIILMYIIATGAIALLHATGLQRMSTKFAIWFAVVIGLLMLLTGAAPYALPNNPLPTGPGLWFIQGLALLSAILFATQIKKTSMGERDDMLHSLVRVRLGQAATIKGIFLGLSLFVAITCTYMVFSSFVHTMLPGGA